MQKNAFPRRTLLLGAALGLSMPLLQACGGGDDHAEIPHIVDFAKGYAEQAVVICHAALNDAVFRMFWPLAPPIWAVRGAFRPDSRPYGRTCPNR
jgi:hypothetical protein